MRDGEIMEFPNLPWALGNGEESPITKATSFLTIGSNKMPIYFLLRRSTGMGKNTVKTLAASRPMLANLRALFHLSLSFSFLSLLSLHPHSISALIFHSACL